MTKSSFFRIYQKIKNALFLAVIFSFIFPGPARLEAADTSKDAFLNANAYNNLINNSSFIDINSMSVADIQSFLASKGSALATLPPDRLGSHANGRNAAQIIYDAAHALDSDSSGPLPDGIYNGIKVNPSTGTVSAKIILTYLEKEQGLIAGDTNPDQDSLDCAMGYDITGDGCHAMFDNHPSLRGFANQVGNGAWQLRYDYEYAVRGTKPSGPATHYVVGENFQAYGEYKYNNPGSQYYNPRYYGPFNVTMSNAATAAVYSYTPYVFDSAYNFWKIFNDWFVASPDTPPAPVPNDTTEFKLHTFYDNITVGGTKSTESKVYFNNQLIQDAGPTNWQITFPASMGNNNLTVEYRDTNGTVLATKPIAITRFKPADINGDGTVNIQDLSIMAAHWGITKPAEPLTDMNGDGIVDILDLSLLAGNWNG